jgi:hypothetical protein
VISEFALGSGLLGEGGKRGERRRRGGEEEKGKGGRKGVR